ncbi:DUF2306 domain-containing protein [Pelagibacterium sp.]|uniref:DUF2306 domain-containing protein n=1 Tax=Pelagibacterium sp. TaxID=1967288 RepID=UPI003A9054A8
MDATPLVVSTFAIQVHAGCAVLALLIGTIVLAMKKGTMAHKVLGRIWIVLMIGVALSSFFITEVRMLGPYSLIHGLSLYTLFGLSQAVMAIRSGDVKAHRGHMIGIYVGALILAGAFTLLPGRRMHAVVFADGGATAMLASIALAALLVAIRYRRGRQIS